MSTSDKIRAHWATHGPATINAISDALGLPKQAVRNVLAGMLRTGLAVASGPDRGRLYGPGRDPTPFIENIPKRPAKAKAAPVLRALAASIASQPDAAPKPSPVVIDVQAWMDANPEKVTRLRPGEVSAASRLRSWKQEGAAEAENAKAKRRA